MKKADKIMKYCRVLRKYNEVPDSYKNQKKLISMVYQNVKGDGGLIPIDEAPEKQIKAMSNTIFKDAKKMYDKEPIMYHLSMLEGTFSRFNSWQESIIESDGMTSLHYLTHLDHFLERYFNKELD
ncbi:hypothetical protein ACFL1H_06865 [Nanoarchaeota archaeon]